jgi:hypothetical protein
MFMDKDLRRLLPHTECSSDEAILIVKTIEWH